MIGLRNLCSPYGVRGACTSEAIAPTIEPMGDFLLDLFLPKTDRIVLAQTLVMAAFWAVVIPLTWRQERDIRHFIWGLFMLNVGWFAARTIH